MQQPYTSFQNATLLVVRVIMAAVFLYATYGKLPFWSGAPEGTPVGMVLLMKFLIIVEPLGGLAVFFGFLTRWAAAGLLIIMVGAIAVMQFMMQVGFATSTGTGWNFPLVVLAGCIVLLAFGPGRYAIDVRRR